MKNYSETVRSVKHRTLSAKGYKFQNRVIELVAKSKGITRYHPEMKPLNEKLRTLITDLFVDKQMTIDEVKGIIRASMKIEIE